MMWHKVQSLMQVLIIFIGLSFVVNAQAAMTVYQFICPAQANADFNNGPLATMVFGSIRVVKDSEQNGFVSAQGSALYAYSARLAWWEFVSAGLRHGPGDEMHIECVYQSAASSNMVTLVAPLPNDLQCQLLTGTRMVRCIP